MLGQQIRAWEVLDDRVLNTFRTVPRERFVPEGYEELAFADVEIPLDHGQSMFAPKIEGRYECLAGFLARVAFRVRRGGCGRAGDPGCADAGGE